MKLCQLKTRNDPTRVMCSVRKRFVLLSECEGCSLALGDPPPVEPSTITEPTVRRYPSLANQAWSLAAALAQFAGSGFKIVNRDEYEQRLKVCDGCPRRNGWQCLECGCIISFKAHAVVWECPLGYWKKGE
jgi:hypothetical protein